MPMVSAGVVGDGPESEGGGGEGARGMMGKESVNGERRAPGGW